MAFVLPQRAACCTGVASSPCQRAVQRLHPAALSIRTLVSVLLATITASAVPAAGQQTPPGTPATTIYGIVRIESREGKDGTISLLQSYTRIPVIVENIDTGQKWEVDTKPGAGLYSVFRLDGLNPGRYRVVIEGIREDLKFAGDDGHWVVEKVRLHDYTARVVLQEYRPVFIDALLRWIEPGSSSPEARGRTPPLTETCGADRSTPINVADEWWGELWGVLRTPDGNNAPAGLRVNIEVLGAPEIGDPFITQTRTTETGCYGTFGLMPGRYRVFVDEPPFVFQAEIQVPARESGGAARLDGQLTAPPERAAGQPLRPAWYSRLRYYHSYYADLLVDAVQLAELDTNVNDPEDLAHLNGAVIWQNEPNDWRQHHRVPGVTLMFEHERTLQQYEVTTDANGSFDLYVPQGRYHLYVVHPPFTTARARILALPEGFVIREGFKTARGSGVYAPRAARRAGLMTGINIGLVMPIDERTSIQTRALDTDSFVTVPAGEPLDPAGSLAPRFTARDLDRPLIGGRSRTLQSLFPLTPGVLMTESIGTLAQFTATGQRRFSNRLTIDGISADLGIDVRGPGIGIAGSESLPALAASGGTETLVPAGAIEEVRIRTTSAPPQFAQTPGAQIAIVTRAGGGTLGGTLFADGRIRSLGARDPFRQESRPPKSQNLGGSVGGPLVSGLRFFGTAEGQQIDRSIRTTIEVPSLALRNSVAPSLKPLFAAFPRPNGAELADGRAELQQEFPVTSALNVFSGRIDGSLSRHHAFGRVNVGRSRGTAIQNQNSFALQMPDLSFDREESTSTWTTTLGVMSALSRSGQLANDLRVGMTGHDGRVVARATSFGDAAALPLADLIGSDEGADDFMVSVNLLAGPHGTVRNGRLGATSQTQLQLSDVITFARWNHEWRGGVEVARVSAGTDPARYWYTYAFTPDYQLRQVTIDELLPARALFETFAAFLQDTFRPSERMTFSLGARYTVKPAPVSQNDLAPLLLQFDPLPASLVPRESGRPLWKTSRTLAPQAGAAYLLRTTPGRSTTLRAGWSLAYDELSSPGAIAFGRGAPYHKARVVRPNAYPVPAGQLSATGPERAEYFAFPESLKPPRTYGWFASVDQELSSTQRLTLSYIGAAGRDLIYWYAYNPTGASPIHVYTNAARSDYDALAVQYVRRLGGGFEAQAVYTWSRSTDTDSGEQLAPHLPPALSSPDAERGPSDYDRPHVLTVTGSYQLPNLWIGSRALRSILSDWRFDIAAVVRSGSPFSVAYLRDFGNGSGYSVRPDSTGSAYWLEDPSSADGRRLNAQAFPIPTEKRQGTLTRNSVRSSTLRQVDFALSRAARVGRTTATVRVEVFNVLGIANYGTPAWWLPAPNFGRPYQAAAEALGTGSLSGGGLTPVQQLGGPRSIQLGLRIGW